MNHEAFLKWAEALESDKYTQAKGNLRLRYPTLSHCVIGVACDVFRDDVGGEWEQNEGCATDTYSIEGHSLNIATMPEKVADLLGIPPELSETCVIPTPVTIAAVREGILSTEWRVQYETSMASLNDSGVDFKSLAKVLRKWVEMDQAGLLI